MNQTQPPLSTEPAILRARARQRHERRLRQSVAQLLWAAAGLATRGRPQPTPPRAPSR